MKVTVSLIKADVGGFPGHSSVHPSLIETAKKELEKAKEYIKGHIALALEDTKNVNELVGINYLFLGKVETPEEIFRKIDKVTAEEVVSEAKKLFVPRKLNLAIIGPYKNAARFERLLH